MNEEITIERLIEDLDNLYGNDCFNYNREQSDKLANDIRNLIKQNKEKQDKLNKVEEKNKALMLLVEWMTECDFGLDNIFNEEDINMTEEQFDKATENMEYNESLIYYAELYLQIIKGEAK